MCLDGKPSAIPLAWGARATAGLTAALRWSPELLGAPQGWWQAALALWLPGAQPACLEAGCVPRWFEKKPGCAAGGEGILKGLEEIKHRMQPRAELARWAG